ncbi:hypothetical protein GMRT_22703 [Giardia muris]|uniref:Ankyrin repeat protein 1 n=1 Tax=Giardia muris TaxID=5742 RepID=A0A4Z1SVV6_GIAMU|nr:hypothetical protein GMRT_22703 [Giardia muris]|eukprot:TNJ29035.1 hypothetical protein GMRT_22703 [Giardia muris]
MTEDWFRAAYAGDLQALKGCRGLLGTRDSEGRTALMRYVGAGHSIELSFFEREMGLLDFKGIPAMKYAIDARNVAAIMGLQPEFTIMINGVTCQELFRAWIRDTYSEAVREDVGDIKEHSLLSESALLLSMPIPLKDQEHSTSIQAMPEELLERLRPELFNSLLDELHECVCSPEEDSTSSSLMRLGKSLAQEYEAEECRRQLRGLVAHHLRLSTLYGSIVRHPTLPLFVLNASQIADAYHWLPCTPERQEFIRVLCMRLTRLLRENGLYLTGTSYITPLHDPQYHSKLSIIEKVISKKARRVHDEIQRLQSLELVYTDYTASIQACRWLEEQGVLQAPRDSPEFHTYELQRLRCKTLLIDAKGITTNALK